MKSLVAILHYNSTQYTDCLYRLLKPYERDDYDLIVIDNGSAEGKSSQYADITLKENLFYGGGLDYTLEHFLNLPEYDSVMLLNSDLIIHGYNFVRGLRESLFSDENLMLASGCVIQPEESQCHWRAIHNWGFSKIRHVPWVDFQCSLLKRELVEEIGSFGSKFGWVQDVMTGIICEKNNWKIGVCDWLPCIHFGNGTVKDNSKDPVISKYNILAEEEMVKFFHQKGLWEDFLQQRSRGEAYTPYNFLKYKINTDEL